MTGVSQSASQSSGESARIQINKFPLFLGGWSHSVCNTVYYKTMCFFTTKTQFFERELFQNRYKLSMKKGDVNKGISIHITTLLIHWTKVHDGMLFCGPLPFLTKPGFTAVNAFVTQYYTKLVCTAFVLWMF